ncbi:hypothetical protein MNBD_ALPHA12-855 [hydrothermal vent metagenome]|uniref:Periplasmic protein YibQ, distant homology with nucleoside diphosphatase and polysaccharide deacetylase n=1 Tax=hydrothermal vent metagenome TaxID=652676 RepID=A0A3B0TF93_9ZZZZ
MASDLNAPLGKKKSKKFLPQIQFDLREFPLARVLAGVLGLIIIAIILRIVLVNDPNGGRPVSEVPISSTRNINSVAQNVRASDPPGPVVVTGANNEANNNQAGATADNTGDQATETAPKEPVVNEDGIFPDLGEQTKYGTIPRVSSSGKTPFAAYSQTQPDQQGADSKPKIAIVVTGMGLNETATLNAIIDLPQNVSLAFAPYSRALKRTIAAAQADGREFLLEVPMEPFDYPNSDPGPQTLLTGQPPRANLDRLFWLMARAGGYIGLINNMGARFTASASDLGPIMEELGLRGLGYLDDGSSNRSLTRQLANANRVPYARAMILLDANPSRAAILAGLDKLESTAREKGQAIGIISALPISITTLVNWAQKLDKNQISLVPVSTLMKARSQ